MIAKVCYFNDRSLSILYMPFTYFRYLASGDSMTSMTFQYLIGKTTVCNIIHETCTAIWDCLWPSVLPPVVSEEEWIELARDFQQLRNFVHCIGAIDGKHVVIQVYIYVNSYLCIIYLTVIVQLMRNRQCMTEKNMVQTIISNVSVS